MQTEPLIYRLVQLPNIWKKKHFTYQDIWNYLDLSQTEFKLMDYDWGRKVMRFIVGSVEINLTVLFKDDYKTDFIDRYDYEEEDLYQIQFLQPITDLKITIKTP